MYVFDLPPWSIGEKISSLLSHCFGTALWSPLPNDNKAPGVKSFISSLFPSTQVQRTLPLLLQIIRAYHLDWCWHRGFFSCIHGVLWQNCLFDSCASAALEPAPCNIRTPPKDNIKNVFIEGDKHRPRLGRRANFSKWATRHSFSHWIISFANSHGDILWWDKLKCGRLNFANDGYWMRSRK